MERLTAAESIWNLPPFTELAILFTLAALVEVSASSPPFSRAVKPESCKLSPAPVATGAVSTAGLLPTFPVEGGGVDGVVTFSVNPFSLTLIGMEPLLDALPDSVEHLNRHPGNSYLKTGKPPETGQPAIRVSCHFMVSRPLPYTLWEPRE
jgi:hypothetical protein